VVVELSTKCIENSENVLLGVDDAGMAGCHFGLPEKENLEILTFSTAIHTITATTTTCTKYGLRSQAGLSYVWTRQLSPPFSDQLFIVSSICESSQLQ
jgi:hypothetical protein